MVKPSESEDGMSIQDILENVANNTWVVIEYRIFDMTFSTRHSAEFYKSLQSADLLEKKVKNIRVDENALIFNV